MYYSNRFRTERSSVLMDPGSDRIQKKWKKVIEWNFSISIITTIPLHRPTYIGDWKIDDAPSVELYCIFYSTTAHYRTSYEQNTRGTSRILNPPNWRPLALRVTNIVQLNRIWESCLLLALICSRVISRILLIPRIIFPAASTIMRMLLY